MRQWSNEEDDFLRENYATKNTYQLAEIWFKKFNVERTALAIRSRAKKVCKGFKLQRAKSDIVKCLNCGKEFKRNAGGILINIRFCSHKCHGEYKLKSYENKIKPSVSQYNTVFKRDKSYIESCFFNYARDEGINYDDIIDHFYKYQLKYYVAISSRLGKPLRLNKFMFYAKMHVLRNQSYQKKVIDAQMREFINGNIDLPIIAEKRFGCIS